MASSPADIYRARFEQRRSEHQHWLGVDARYAYARLVVFAGALALAVVVFRGAASAWTLLVPLVAFSALVRRHDRVIRSRDAAARAIAFYERGLARIEDRWVGTGATGDRFRDEAHLYANDLDLFGRGSLFELLSIAGTPAGEETLAAWLKEPATGDEIAARQQAIAELTPYLDLREALGRTAADARERVHSAELLAWAEAPPAPAPLWLRLIALLLTAAVVATLGILVTIGESLPLLLALGVQALFIWPQLRDIEHVLHQAERAREDLIILGHLLTRIEAQSFGSPRLRALQSQLQTGTTTASDGIRALHRLVSVHEWQHNLVFLILSMPFLVGTRIAWAIERWRTQYGGQIRPWIAAAGEFEALASLSAYRYEHPDDPFPTFGRDDEPACFDGRQLGHPLLPAATLVRNDVTLDAPTRLLVVSGSNMSGKSTLLRTVGINAVLALAGAPVRAATLRMTRLAIGGTLRIQDSLQEGRSRFYAEITRIRQLADLAAGAPPLLFLLDELFHGTNSHDRLIGSAGVLRSLLDRGAIGLITTHDLALTAIAERLGARAANVHFEEWFDAGEMRFDYRLKPGPVTRSNALALMRAVGLEVESHE